jgi:alpha-D-xyloside xylohydrolase
MSSFLKSIAILVSIFPITNANTIPRSDFPPITITSDGKTLVTNNAILIGTTNTSLTPINPSTPGVSLTYQTIDPQVLKIEITASSSSYIGAEFTFPSTTTFYGVWEYPFSNQLSNTGVSFDLKGVGNGCGINWSNARAPFFISSSGVAVYTDTLDMGSFDFSQPNFVSFNFNTSSLTYYIILPKEEGDFKSLIKEYMGLSSRIEMPPDSEFGPTFWSDDFTQDFHGNVTNAQENYFDVINHLTEYQIRATDMFADRKLSYS